MRASSRTCYPPLAVVSAIPFLRRFWPARTVYTAVALALLAWGMLASLVRPDVFEDGSTATYVVLGSMLTFGAVVLISQHQAVLLRPLRWLVRRPTQRGLATRLAIAYPPRNGSGPARRSPCTASWCSSS